VYQPRNLWRQPVTSNEQRDVQSVQDGIDD
jgi:hypothetical protein